MGSDDKTPYGAMYDVVTHAAEAWDRALAAVEHGSVATDQANRGSARCASQAREHQARISAIISEASEMMEEAVTGGRGKEARLWIDALSEMYKVYDTVETAVRLAHESMNAPWMPGKESWSVETSVGGDA